MTRRLWHGRWGGRISTPPGIVRFWYERKERADRREDADDARDWHAGDDARGVCARLNAAARVPAGDEPRASRA